MSASSFFTAVNHLTRIFFKSGALAKVPFTARPPTQSDADEKIDIFEHYPKMEQFLKVGRLSGSTDFHATPVLNVNTLGGGVSLSGVGVDKHRVDDQPYLISLSAIRLTLSDQPRCISWCESPPNLQN